MTFRDCARKYTTALATLYDAGEARALFSQVVSHFCNLSGSDLLMKREEEIPGEVTSKIIGALHELVMARPVQYILGETVFCGFTVKVNPSVLIPRPETEELIHWIIQDSRPKSMNGEVKILDIGTGSGCIAIALAKFIPGAKVHALDNSEDALRMARENSTMNSANVTFVLADILEADTPAGAFGGSASFDVIASNPPYITEAEKSGMHPNVIANEPHAALFAGTDPLIFYRAIAFFAASKLVKGGKLFLEINENMGEEVISLLEGAGFSGVELRKDLNGKDRMVKGVFY